MTRGRWRLSDWRRSRHLRKLCTTMGKTEGFLVVPGGFFDEGIKPVYGFFELQQKLGEIITASH